MKKLAFIFLILIVFTLGFTETAKAWDSGCGYGTYSITTGQYCGSSTTTTTTTTYSNIPGCNGYNQYSTVTGQYCYGSNNTNYGYSSYTFTRELGLGSRGEDVVQYQTLLTNRGYSVGRIDGVFGSATRRATINYQSANALPITGNGDTETLTSISSGVTYNPTYPPQQPNCPPTYVNGVPTYSCNTNSGVTISGVSGPQYLTTYQSGTWTVNAYSQLGGNLSYSVDWGDQYTYGAPTYSYYNTQQTSTFTHSYATAGTYTARFTVTNQYGQTAQTSVTVTVGGNNNNGGNIIIDTTSLPNGYVGTSYYATISASGNNNYGYSWSITNGSLPPGLYLSNITCVTYPCYGPATISGTPTTAGTYTFTANVSGGTYGGYGSRTFTIIISGNNGTGTPTITSLNPTSAAIGALVYVYGTNINSNTRVYMGGYEVQVATTGTNYVGFYVPSQLNAYCPPGQACTLQYVTTNPGAYNVYITNGYGTSNTATLTVTGSSSSMNISSLSPSSGYAGTYVTIYGTGFTTSGNKIKFGNMGTEYHHRYNNLSSNGNSISFYVPNSNAISNCDTSGPYCTSPAPLFPGTYPVSVINGNGVTSNSLNFIVY